MKRYKDWSKKLPQDERVTGNVEFSTLKRMVDTASSITNMGPSRMSPARGGDRPHDEGPLEGKGNKIGQGVSKSSMGSNWGGARGYGNQPTMMGQFKVPGRKPLRMGTLAFDAPPEPISNLLPNTHTLMDLDSFSDNTNTPPRESRSPPKEQTKENLEEVFGLNSKSYLALKKQGTRFEVEEEFGLFSKSYIELKRHGTQIGGSLKGPIRCKHFQSQDIRTKIFGCGPGDDDEKELQESDIKHETMFMDDQEGDQNS